VPLTLPNLDDRTYADLVAEALALIPALAPDWTDHNPADPGITLIELFAWLTEMLVYRLDQVTDENRLAFLRLINGPGWGPRDGKSVVEEVRDTIQRLREPARAVTADDFERLACAADPRVARARCVPRRDLERGRQEERVRDRPADISLVILATPEPALLPVAQPSRQPSSVTLLRAARVPLLRAVRDALEPARLLTTRLHVVAPRRITIFLELTVRGRRGAVVARPAAAAQRGAITLSLTIHGRDDAIEGRLLAQAETELMRFLDPHTGGPARRGWPFGRAVYLSEIYDLLARLPDADYVMQTADKPPFAPAGSNRLATGELPAITFDADELPEAKIPKGDIKVTPGTA
jgi:hypothetical protein